VPILPPDLGISAPDGDFLPEVMLCDMSKPISVAYFSGKLFDNPRDKRVVRKTRRFLP
jgi:hypothetical protein